MIYEIIAICLYGTVFWTSIGLCMQAQALDCERNLLASPVVLQARDEVVRWFQNGGKHNCYLCDTNKPHFHHYCGRVIRPHESFCATCCKTICCMKCKKRTEDLKFVPNSYSPYVCRKCYHKMEEESIRRLRLEANAFKELFFKNNHIFQSDDSPVNRVTTSFKFAWLIITNWRLFYNVYTNDEIRHILESVMIAMGQIMMADKWSQYPLIIAGAFKMIVPKPFFSEERLKRSALFVKKIIKKLHESVKNGKIIEETDIHFQSDDSLIFDAQLNPIAQIRDIWKRREILKTHPIMSGYRKLFSYLLVLGVFSRMNIDFEKLYTEDELFNVKKKYSSRWSFTEQLIDTGLLTIDKCYQSYKLGTIDPLIHCVDSYSAWYEQALLLKRRSEFLGNPEALGFTVSSFFADLSKCIETGKAICKTLQATDRKQYLFFRKVLADVEMIYDVTMTKDNAGKERKAPFCMLVHGGSSSGKSSFAHQLFVHYGKLFNEKVEPRFKYTRNPSDEYWNNFKSYMWCGQFDDIAFMHPDKCQGVDPSLIEMIAVNNIVSYVPNQAALEEKGRTPVLFKLLLATTNTMDLNLNSYFSCPLAVARRMPYIVTIKPKPEYLKEMFYLDSQKVPELQPGEYYDYWDIVVHKVVPAIVPGNDRRKLPTRCDFVKIYETSDIYRFIHWYSKKALQHEEEQDKTLESMKLLTDIELCRKCYAPNQRCRCALVRTWSVLLKKPEDELWDAPLFNSREKCLQYAQKFSPEVYDRLRVFFASQDSPRSSIQTIRRQIECENAMFAEEMELRAGIETHGMEIYGPEYRSPEILPVAEPVEVEERLASLCPLNCRINHIHIRPTLVEELMYQNEEDIVSTTEKIRKAHEKATAMEIVDNMTNDEQLEMQYVLRDSVVENMCRRLNKRHSNFCSKYIPSVDPQFDYSLLPSEKIRFWFYCKCLSWSNVPGFSWLFAKLGGEMFDTTLNPSNRYLYHLVKKSGQDVRDSLDYPSLLLLLFSIYALCKSTLFLWSFFRSTNLEAQSLGDIGVEFGEDEKSETSVRWDPDPFQVTKHELSQQSMSWKKFGDSKINELVAPNLGIIEFYYRRGDEVRRSTNRMFSIGGQYWLVNKHAIPESVVQVVIRVGKDEAHSENKVLSSIKSLTFRNIHEDIAMIKIPFLRTRRNMLPYLPKNKIETTLSGYYLTFSKDGNDILVNRVRNCREVTNFPGRRWMGYPERPTVSGECGSVLILNTSKGPFVAGLHWVKEGEQSGAISLYQNYFTGKVPKDLFDPGEPNLVDGDGKKIPLKPLREKSVMQYNDGHIVVKGSLPERFSSRKSQFVDTKLRPLMKELEQDTDHAPAILKSYVPWRDTIVNVAAAMPGLPAADIETAMQGYINDVLDKIPKADVRPVSYSTAINGAPGVKYVDRLKKNTSMGFPWFKPKKQFLEEIEEDRFDFPPPIKERIEEIWNKYDNGMLACPIFVDCLKDEALPRRKIESKGTRVFSAAPADWSVVVRMLTLRFSRLFYLQAGVFEAACGIDCWSSAWNDLALLLKNFSKFYGAGDYKKFDKKMEASIILAAFEVIARLYEAWGMSEHDANKIRMIGHDTAFSFHDFDGDLVQFLMSNPSGQPLTIIINCIVGSLYFRLVYLNTKEGRERGIDKFQEDVFLRTCGDDNIFSSRVEWFNMCTLHDVLKDWNIDYTMADKVSEMRPWMKFEELTFLKRYFVYNAETGHYHGRLEKESITKSLCIGKISDDPDAQSVSLMLAALREFFNFGRDEYNYWRRNFSDFVDNLNLGVYLDDELPSYDYFLELYKSENLVTQSEDVDVEWKSKICNVCCGYCDFPNYLLQDFIFSCYFCGECCLDSQSYEDETHFLVCRKCVASQLHASVDTATSLPEKSLEPERGRREWTEAGNPPGRSPKSVFTEGQAETNKVTRAPQ